MSSVATAKDLELPFLASPLDSLEVSQLESKRTELKGRVELAKASEMRAVNLIEAHFGEKRSGQNPYAGVITTMTRAKLENGNEMLGGAYISLFPCPDDRCPQFIHPDLVSPTLGVTVCPRCGRQWLVKTMSSERAFCLTTQNWAVVISRMFVRMNLNADIRINYSPRNLIKATITDQERGKMARGESIKAVRAARTSAMYTMPRLHVDLSSGAAIETCIRAFLEA